MKIPVPEQINLFYAVFFATIVFIVQIAEGSDVVFSGLFCVYMVLTVIAFNACGGFAHPSGSLVFFNAVLTTIFGILYKIILVEPADSHLLAPTVTMSAYVLSMVMMAGSAALSRRLVPKRGLLEKLGVLASYKKAAIGSLVFGTIGLFAGFSDRESGTFLSALRQINTLPLLAVILGTFYEVKQSNGKSCFNWIVFVSMAVSLFFGIIGASKEGMAAAPVAWFLTAVLCSYDFKRIQIILIIACAAFFSAFLVPYSQIARNTRPVDLAGATQNALLYLENLGLTRQQFLESQQTAAAKLQEESTSTPHIYDNPQGFFDRLNMLAPDDALIAYTDDGNLEGLYPMYFYVTNLVPHFLWPDKPDVNPGNLYGREIGMIHDEDTSTGISFSPAGDAYHEAGFWGVFLLVPAVMFFNFFITDSLSGDIRVAPWGILFVVFNAHEGPEGMLGGQLYTATYKAFGVIVVAVFAGYVLPIIVGAFTGQDRTRVRRSIDFKPIQPTSTNI